MCSDLGALSQGCAFFSATGILFMSFVGIMYMKQPFFTGGFETAEDADKMQKSAFGAAGFFFFIFCASAIYMIWEGQQQHDRFPVNNGSIGLDSNGESYDDRRRYRGGVDYGRVPLNDSDATDDIPRSLSRGTFS